MKKIVIHIGLHKTATTFFQEKIWPRVKGYAYLTRPYTQHNLAFNQLQYADGSLYNAALIRDETAILHADNLLISDESLSGKTLFFSSVNRSAIAGRLKELFPEATIIVFLRDQIDMMVSCYNSYIKMPYGVKQIERLFWKPQKNYTYQDYQRYPQRHDQSTLYYNTNDYFIHIDCFIYSQILELYSRLFKRVEIFLYEDVAHQMPYVVERLNGIFEQKIDVDAAILQERLNVSLPYEALERKRLFNKASNFSSNKKIATILGGLLWYAIGKRSAKNDLHERMKLLAGDYYTRDNLLIKKKYPMLHWSAYPDKYV